jgi:hypothetical protein
MACNLLRMGEFILFDHTRIDDVLAIVAWRQRRNQGAYLSHRKRRETES